MTKQVINTPHPTTLPYSKGIKTGQFIFVAGTVGHQNPDTGEEIKGIEAQTRQCLEGIKEVLESAGASLDGVVSTTVYITRADDFQRMNEVYKTYFPQEPPARATVVVGLMNPAMLIEIQAIACCPE